MANEGLATDELARESGGAGSVGASDSVALLRTMIRSREFDRRAGVLCRQGKAWLHVSAAGHEGLAGAGHALRPTDMVFPHYRDRPLLLAGRMSLLDMARDLIGSRNSPSGGRNMSAHFSKRETNVFSIASPVGSQCLPAVGAAWAMQRRGTDDVVLCSIGDASIRQGEFFEAVMFAVERRLPVVFLISDNGYGISSSTRGTAPLHVPVLDRSLVEKVDGTDPWEVGAAVGRAATAARSGEGPRILWCELDRLDSHTTSDDHRVYRPAEELDSLRDPLELFAGRLVDLGELSTADLADEWASARAAVADAMASAIAEGSADIASLGKDLFSGTTSAGPRPRGGSETIVSAVNSALRRGLEEYPEMIVFGEDIEDPKGGVFGFTKGLGSCSGGRVVNSPLAEATIVGAAVGLAAVGMRPVVELQFIDFVGPAWNQLTGQVSTLRWRTEGDWSCPVVMYAPYGAYLPGGGIWHSQSNEAWFTHIPGLHVAVVSNPDDAEDVFLDAFASADPTLILLPKHLMRVRHQGAGDRQGTGRRARLLRTGADVSIVTWGNGVELGSEAVGELSRQGVSAELVDLCWLAPWDRETVARSVRKTGRLVVVQEDNRTSSFGASLIAELMSDDECFGALLAPPRLVARDDIHIPFHPELERAVLPTVDDVVAASLALMS